MAVPVELEASSWVLSPSQMVTLLPALAVGRAFTVTVNAVAELVQVVVELMTVIVAL